MVTIVPLPIEGNVEPGALHSSSQDVSPSSGVCGRHPFRHRHGPRRHGSSPTRVGRRHHQGPDSNAQIYGQLDLELDLMHHGSLHGNPRGRHFSRGAHNTGMHGHESPSGQRRHRSLSPRHLFHHRPSESSLGKPHREHREHEGKVPVDGAFHHFCERHVLHHSQEHIQGPQVRRYPHQPAAIEQGIEQFRQISLTS